MKKVFVALTAVLGFSAADMMSDSLAAHNNERNAYGVPSLTWSASLAQTAQAYAEVQAQTGTTSHSTGRVNVGENLAWGSGSNINTASLAGMWIAEKQDFIPGCTFPDCSTTGSWHDVAHYTQLMWEKTTEVGCGLAKSSSGRNYYVCHYSPQGNMDGEPVYSGGSAIANTQGNTQDNTQGNSQSNTPDTTQQNAEQNIEYNPEDNAEENIEGHPAHNHQGNTEGNTHDNNPSKTHGHKHGNTRGSNRAHNQDGNNNNSQTAPVTSNPTTTTTSTTTPTSTSTPTTTTSSQSSGSQDQFVTDSLAAHNNERSAHGVPALTWSTSLAQSAQAYAEVQAQTGTTSHSTGRVNVGENLAWGSGSHTTTASLAGMWVAEKQYFIAGKNFPDCSTTGSWHDVAHYTQLMWRKTTQLGCGIAKSGSGTNYYVCHYSPQGNINGNPVY